MMDVLAASESIREVNRIGLGVGRIAGEAARGLVRPWEDAQQRGRDVGAGVRVESARVPSLPSPGQLSRFKIGTRVVKRKRKAEDGR